MLSRIFSVPKIFVLAFVAAIACPQVHAQQQQATPRQVAALMEEVAALRNEVSRLRADVEDLREENARLLERAESRDRAGSTSQAEIAALRVEINGKFETLRKDIFADMEKRIAQSNADTNSALKKMQVQVNDALAGISRGDNAAATVAGQAPVAKPADMPDNGRLYKIRGGDTLSKIAREQGSKVNWILYANEGLNPNRLVPGQEILIPQN